MLCFSALTNFKSLLSLTFPVDVFPLQTNHSDLQYLKLGSIFSNPHGIEYCMGCLDTAKC